MTAHELHALSRDDDEYDVGFTTQDGRVHFNVRSERGDTIVDFHAQFSAGAGVGSTSFFKLLTADDARELSLALERAADAAERTKA